MSDNATALKRRRNIAEKAIPPIQELLAGALETIEAAGDGDLRPALIEAGKQAKEAAEATAELAEGLDLGDQADAVEDHVEKITRRAA